MIGISDGWIFDPTLSRALELGHENIEWCCGYDLLNSDQSHERDANYRTFQK